MVDAQACTVIAQGHEDAAVSPEGWSLDFKPAPDPSCTIARVQEGICSACTATAAADGKCAAGTHTFIMDAVSPAGLHAEEALVICLQIGAAVLSGELTIQLELLRTQGAWWEERLTPQKQDCRTCS